MSFRRNCLLLLFVAIPSLLPGQTTAPVIVATNTTIRVMAANLTSGNTPYYQDEGLRIMKGLKPDVVAIQEFNYDSPNYAANAAAGFREMLDANFGTNFVYVRESGTGIDIPNGIISRFPILTNGVWDDPEIGNRDFLWAKLDIPGTNELYVVSVHLKSGSSDASTRSAEANVLKSRIQSEFPTNAFVILAGDMNIHSTSETALNTLKSFLSDNPIPHDGTASANPNTNAGRDERYDYVFPSFTLSTNRVPTVIGSRTFNNGLVFDSRVYTPLTDVPPVLQADSGASQMQHMAVVKDFRISYTVTNFVTIQRPLLTLSSTNIIRWQGQSNVTYTVQASTNFTNWASVGTASSSSTNIAYTNPATGLPRRFYRVVYP